MKKSNNASSHSKIRTAKGASRILLIDAGQVVAYGTHEELLQMSVLYKKSQSLNRRWRNNEIFPKAFGYEPILTKDDVKQVVKKRRDLAQQIGKAHYYVYGK